MFDFKSALRHTNSKKANILFREYVFKGSIREDKRQKLIYFEEETEDKIILVGVLEIPKSDNVAMKRFEKYKNNGKNLLKATLNNPSSDPFYGKD